MKKFKNTIPTPIDAPKSYIPTAPLVALVQRLSRLNLPVWTLSDANSWDTKPKFWWLADLPQRSYQFTPTDQIIYATSIDLSSHPTLKNPLNCTRHPGFKWALELGQHTSFQSIRHAVKVRIRLARAHGIAFESIFNIDEQALTNAALHLAERFESEQHSQDPRFDEVLKSIGSPPLDSKFPARWYKKELLRQARQAVDFAHLVMGQIGSRGAASIVSDQVLKSRKIQLQKQAEFAAQNGFQTITPNGRITVPFANAATSAKKRANKAYARVVGLEKFCLKKGLCGYFVTLTLPGAYHPNPEYGNCTWQGVTHSQSHAEIQRRWRQFQRRAFKTFGMVMGVRVEEPHKDGCPHWHLLVWIAPENEQDLKRLYGQFFGNNVAADVEKIDLKQGTGASYVMKYIMPIAEVRPNAENTDARLADTAARYGAHRACWGARAIQFFDLPGSSTLWDEFRRIKPGSDQASALSSHSAQLHQAAISGHYCDFLSGLENIPLDEITGDRLIRVWYVKNDTSSSRRVQGIIDFNQQIDTHVHLWKIVRNTQKVKCILPEIDALETPDTEKTGGTVMLNSPRHIYAGIYIKTNFSGRPEIRQRGSQQVTGAIKSEGNGFEMAPWSQSWRSCDVAGPEPAARPQRGDREVARM